MKVAFRIICLIVFVSGITACGGGGSDSPSNPGGGGTTGGTPTGGSGGTEWNPPTGSSVDYEVPAVAVGAPVTDLSVTNTSGSTQTDVPITFGQVFAPGAVPGGTPVMVREATGSKAVLPTQVDVKATNADGSIRHAVITARVPSIAANAKRNLELTVVDSAPDGSAVALSDLLDSGFDATVTLDVGGTTYTASAADQLSGSSVKTWLQGPQVTEWITGGALKDSGGSPHPHLTARFHVRAYSGLDAVRVDVIVENDWAYQANPQNITYDAQVSVCGSLKYTKNALTHYDHARWRKTFWCGTKPQINIAQNAKYMFDSGALPNYDTSLDIPESDLADMQASWSGPNVEPMGKGTVEEYMPGTGARADIGPLPRWAVRYLLSQDPRAKTVTLGNASLAGSWPIHYRDKNTDLPVTIDDYPYMTIKGGESSTRNPATGLYESFPACGGDCDTPYSPDSAHQPSLAYVPYLITGDYYYLEELEFWANYNILQAHPDSREHSKGLVKWEQVRGQAWSLRTLGNAAYILPDDDPLKSYFVEKVNNNIDYYDATYTNNSSAPALGFVINGFVLSKPKDGKGLYSPWNDDALTTVVDWLVGMGFSNAIPFRNWKVQFVYGRYTHHPVFCKQDAASYRYVIQDPYIGQDGPVIGDWAELEAASFPDHVGNCPTEFGGYPQNPESYLSITRGALAAAAAAGYGGVPAIFDELDAAQSAAGADFNSIPQWAIVPR
jgi:hypothetical protein